MRSSRIYEVIALAGRRTDALHAEKARFPLENTGRVRDELTQIFLDANAKVLVSSAACGADLTALQVAFEVGMECHVVLPFSRTKFRQTSVSDRPGEWAVLFDRLLNDLPADAVTLVQPPSAGEDPFELANREIVQIAKDRAAPKSPLAVAVWDGASRGKGDATASFIRLARGTGMRVRSVRTC